MAKLFNRAVRIVAATTVQITDRDTISIEVLDPDTGKVLSGNSGTKKTATRTLTIENLRVQFKVKKTSKKEPNSCDLTIYNLSADSRGKISRDVKLTVEAGYVGTLAQIFSGDALTVDHVHDGPNWITRIQCNDGERAYRFSTVSESFKAGTGFGDVFEKVASKTGLDVADAVKFIRGEIKDQFTRGFVAHGFAFSELDRLLKDRGLDYSIQDGRLQILKAGTASKDSAITLSSSTGLIGSPAHGTGDATTSKARAEKASILKVKSLLQPGIKPGRKLKVESVDISGSFVARDVLHSGDTAGGDWYSDVEAVPE